MISKIYRIFLFAAVTVAVLLRLVDYTFLGTGTSFLLLAFLFYAGLIFSSRETVDRAQPWLLVTVLTGVLSLAGYSMRWDALPIILLRNLFVFVPWCFFIACCSRLALTDSKYFLLSMAILPVPVILLLCVDSPLISTAYHFTSGIVEFVQSILALMLAAVVLLARLRTVERPAQRTEIQWLLLGIALFLPFLFVRELSHFAVIRLRATDEQSRTLLIVGITALLLSFQLHIRKSSVEKKSLGLSLGFFLFFFMTSGAAHFWFALVEPFLAGSGGGASAVEPILARSLGLSLFSMAFAGTASLVDRRFLRPGGNMRKSVPAPSLPGRTSFSSLHDRELSRWIAVWKHSLEPLIANILILTAHIDALETHLSDLRSFSPDDPERVPHRLTSRLQASREACNGLLAQARFYRGQVLSSSNAPVETDLIFILVEAVRRSGIQGIVFANREPVFLRCRAEELVQGFARLLRYVRGYCRERGIVIDPTETETCALITVRGNKHAKITTVRSDSAVPSDSGGISFHDVPEVDHTLAEAVIVSHGGSVEYPDGEDETFRILLPKGTPTT